MGKELIKTAVTSLYQMQKLRVQQGNRITAAFRTKLGLESSQAEEEVPEANNMLDDLRKEFKRITDGVKRVTVNIKIDSPLITSAAELALIEAYERQLEAEALHEKAIARLLDEQPIWGLHLKGVRGCGTMMAGAIISQIDIHKCNSISALWKYAGLDVVVTETEGGETLEEGRCRKKHHLVPREYVDRDGEIKETVGITFNPFLKTKLIGVLGSSFIKLGGEYREIYDNYKHRLEHHPKHKEKTKGHRHNMAVRYMIKEFLADLWTEWRKIEGLPVRPRYSEEKLGIVHSRAA